MATVRRLFKARLMEVATVKIAAKPATVFDNQDMTAPYTQYVFKLKSAGKNATKDEWKLRKRYSAFHTLHQKFRRTKRKWELEPFKVAVEVLQQVVGSEFPRKHVRCDTVEIIHERRRRLMDYMRALLAAYSVLDVLLGVNGGIRDHGGEGLQCLRTLLIETERFLEIPPKRKEIEMRLSRTIMALDGVEASPESDGEAVQCCICLGDSDLNADEVMASLPCAHVFHEDCIIRWLLCGSTCPICRCTVGHAARRVTVG